MRLVTAISFLVCVFELGVECWKLSVERLVSITNGLHSLAGDPVD